MNAARDDEIMLLGANTDNPGELLAALRAIEAAANRQAQSQAYQLPRYLQQFGGPASVATAPQVSVDYRIENARTFSK